MPHATRDELFPNVRHKTISRHRSATPMKTKSTTDEIPRKKPAAGTHRRQEAIRLPLATWGRQAGLHHEALARRQRSLGIEPGEDGCFTLPAFLRIAHGDKEAETIGKIAEERKKLERENREAEGELVPVERVCILGERYVAAVRQVILNSSLSDTEKQEALGEIVQLGETDWEAEAKANAKGKR